MVANSKTPMFSSSQLALILVLSLSLMFTMTSASVHHKMNLGKTIFDHQNYVKTPQTHKVKNALNFTLDINQSQELNMSLYGNAFLKGLDANTLLSANTTSCFNDALWFYYHELPLSQIKIYYSSFDDMLFNTT